MAVSARITPIDRQIELIISTSLSKEARSAKLAEFAQTKLAEAQAAHRAQSGSVPPHETTVDQRRGAAVESVRPDGEIVFEFELIQAALVGISDMLDKASPVLTGAYRRSHRLFADGVETDLASAPPGASEFVFLSVAPYARAIERGISKSAPEGVYHVVSVLAARRYGNIAQIRFSFRSAVGGSSRADRAPAIIIRGR